jgi:hypothetical protein
MSNLLDSNPRGTGRKPRKIRVHPLRVKALYQELKRERDYTQDHIAQLLDHDTRTIRRYSEPVDSSTYSPIPWGEWCLLCLVHLGVHPHKFRAELQDGEIEKPAQ